MILLFISFTSSACSFDTDCAVGSKCSKDQYSLTGTCIGGMNPGNAYDSGTPYKNPIDINNNQGNTCQFNTDCGPGSRCLKSSSSINGVCMPSNY